MASQYNQLVLDHYRNPRNFGKLEKLTRVAEDFNPLCGDEIKVYLLIKDGRLEDIKYEARGCALSIAAASVLSETIKGRQASDIHEFNKTEIEKLLKIKVSEARESCITLALTAIKKALS